jgi:hypothetical protein
MEKYLKKPILFLLLLWMLIKADGAVADTEAVLSVDGIGSVITMHRYGLNLGGPSAWGSEQLLSNIVANPGFEPVLEKSLVKVSSVSANAFGQQKDWNARTEGFWDGATGAFITGKLTGKRFNVLSHQLSQSSKQLIFETDQSLLGLVNGDIVAVTKTSMGGAPAKWWSQGTVQTESVQDSDSGLGPSGQQTVRLRAIGARTAQLSSYIDTLERAGRLLPVQGQWTFSFKVKSNSKTPVKLRIRFAREGETVFIDRVLSPKNEWTAEKWHFQAHESSSGRGPLGLSFTLEQGDVSLDDVYLGESTPGAGGFRNTVVSTLKNLHPGYLRDWQGQLGDTAFNRFAPEFSRQPVRYRPGESEIIHTYGIPQVLALCKETGATPWLIFPSTLDQQDSRLFARQLKTELIRLKISEAVLEFGNENWNALFEAGGITAVSQHIQAITHAFEIVRTEFTTAAPTAPKLTFVANARLGDTDSFRVLSSSPMVDRVAMAPYFMYNFDAAQSLDSAIQDSFTPGDQDQLKKAHLTARQQGKYVSAYELNFHTTEGTASAVQRNVLSSGAASGPALAARLLSNSLLGIQEQAVYVLAGFDAYTANQKLVRLFGITRDLSVPDRLRPTGVALTMLNRVVGGKLIEPTCSGSDCAELVSAAFVDEGTRWAIVNRGATPKKLRLRQGCSGKRTEAWLLDGHDSLQNNEFTDTVKPEMVEVTCQGKDAAFVLPARSLLTLN